MLTGSSQTPRACVQMVCMTPTPAAFARAITPFQVSLELRKIEMAMAVYEHHFRTPFHLRYEARKHWRGGGGGRAGVSA